MESRRSFAPRGVVELGAFVLGIFTPGCAPPTSSCPTPAPAPVLDAVVDAELERLCADRAPTVLGGVLAVVGDDGVRRYGTCGSADRAHTRDVVLSDRFRVGSVAKTFTAALTLMLVDEGAVSLDDTVASFGVVTDGADAIRVRHLLSHTSGLVDYNSAVDFDWSRSWTIPEVITWVTDTYEPSFAPGMGVGYSGTGYQVLAEIAGSEGRAAYPVALRERIFSRLCLGDTFLEGAEPIPGGRVEGSVYTSGTEPGPPEITNDWASADGSIVSNAPDLLTFLEHLFVDRDLVSAAGVTAMTTQATLEDGTPVELFGGPYGLGVFIEDAPGGPIYWHGGLDYGFRAYAGIQPATGRAVVVLLNSETPDARSIAGEAWALLATP